MEVAELLYFSFKNAINSLYISSKTFLMKNPDHIADPVQNLSPRNYNTGLVSSGDILTSWGEGDSLALVGHPSSDSVTIKMPYGVDLLLHQPALHPIISFWVG